MSRRVPLPSPMNQLDEAVQGLEFVMETISHACGDNGGWPAWMFLVFPQVKAARAALDLAFKEQAGERARSTSYALNGRTRRPKHVSTLVTLPPDG